MLAPEIRGWEPTIALDGGPDGLDTYRRIIAEGHKYLDNWRFHCARDWRRYGSGCC